MMLKPLHQESIYLEVNAFCSFTFQLYYNYTKITCHPNSIVYLQLDADEFFRFRIQMWHSVDHPMPVKSVVCFSRSIQLTFNQLKLWYDSFQFNLLCQ